MSDAVMERYKTRVTLCFIEVGHLVSCNKYQWLIWIFRYPKVKIVMLKVKYKCRTRLPLTKGVAKNLSGRKKEKIRTASFLGVCIVTYCIYL